MILTLIRYQYWFLTIRNSYVINSIDLEFITTGESLNVL